MYFKCLQVNISRLYKWFTSLFRNKMYFGKLIFIVMQILFLTIVYDVAENDWYPVHHVRVQYCSVTLFLLLIVILIPCTLATIFDCLCVSVESHCITLLVKNNFSADKCLFKILVLAFNLQECLLQTSTPTKFW